MADEKIFTARFKVEDDGSIVLDKISGKLVDVGVKGQESLGKISSSLSIIKLDSIINLGERAFHTGQQIYNFGKEVASSLNDIDRMSKVMGISTDIFQKLRYAAKMTDVDIESMSVGIRKLSSNMADGSTIFERLGVSIKTSSGELKPLDMMLMDLADRFSRMQDGAGKVAIAIDLFGRSGEKLIPFLNRGSTGIKEFYIEAERLGVVLDKDIIEKGSKAEDAFKRIDERLQSMKLRFAPIALGFVTMFDDMLRAATDFNDNPEMKKWWTPIEPQFGRKKAGVGEWPSEARFVPKEPALLLQSEAALKAIAAANEKILEQNYKLSDLYDYEANVLKGQAKSLETREKAMGLLEKLGLKTEVGAKREIEDVMAQYRLLGTLGLKSEEMGQARAKIEEQLKAIGEKYKTDKKMEESAGHWEEIMVPSGKEISGIRTRTKWESEWRWIEDVRVQLGKGKGGLTESVEAMVNESIDLLNKMQAQMDAVTKGPNKVMIDTSEFANANLAVDTLRIKLESMTERAWPVHIAITGSGSSELPIMEKIDQIYGGIQNLTMPRWHVGLGVHLYQERIKEYMRLMAQTPGGGIAPLSTPAESQAMQSMPAGISINIGTIVVQGGDRSMVEALDQELADLWVNNRSKLKMQIQG